MCRTRSLWSIAFVCALLAACTQQPSGSSGLEEEFQARVRHLEDMTAIEKLQASYVHSLFTQRYQNIPALFAQNAPDVRVEFSDSGVFDGRASIERLYNAFARTRDVLFHPAHGGEPVHRDCRLRTEREESPVVSGCGKQPGGKQLGRVAAPRHRRRERHARSRGGRAVDAVQALQ